MKVILIRHGESEGNVAGEINDDPARVVNLTAYGRAQAEVAAHALRKVPITHAYASEFARTQQTAAILLRGRDLALRIDARLNERRSGMDGQHADTFRNLVLADPLRIKPAHGESFLEQMARLRSFLDEIVARHLGGVVLVISHEDPILAAQALFSDDPARVALGHLGNCEWVELDGNAARAMKS